MKTRHKYFRNLRYKQKLERLSDETCYVKFLTTEEDPKESSKYKTARWYNPSKHHNIYYEYWHRPEVPYSAMRGYYGSGGRSSAKRWYKKYSNKVIRRTRDIGDCNSYKRVFDLGWTLD